jgi:GT2 family glycosyltransferase
MRISATSPAPEQAEAVGPFPASLALIPTSRWPTQLPDATLRTVVAQPLPQPGTLAAPGAAPDRPHFSIVIVTLNNLVYNRLCLESLLANTPEPGYEIVIVDNGSTDGTVSYLRHLERSYPHIRVKFNDRNLGFARANNLGLALARGVLLLLLNNDTIVPTGWLARLVRYAEDPAIGLVGPVTNRTGNEAQIEVSYRTYGELLHFAQDYSLAHAGENFDIRMLAMFCVALRRDVFERIGPLDERFEVGLFEDDDYAMRVREAGLRVVCAEDAFVHHFGQASIGQLAARGEYGERFHANRRLWEAKWRTTWRPYEHRVKPQYQQLTHCLRALVNEHLPPGATVVVVSKGDEELLELEGRPAWHFPRGPDGGYAGYNPADSAGAISHLEELRAAGGQYLLLPGTALWWLDFYADFRRHLESRYRLVVRQDDVCIIFELQTDA